ncbi:hypothetical protein BDDG_05769 [Blastomyces dermatitidis ATCC 18188]|uniref:Uncharacterized protein n=1 Tax=Ajellomyces dermatitidis (strain ATCC 18188 / CBS 674.68) TaxID=653446 RepID=F2THW2_AJEDA|nr:hypothetical protein BDDG_05769 [Blastomyces dermatitidis ATCC 18188]
MDRKHWVGANSFAPPAYIYISYISHCPYFQTRAGLEHSISLQYFGIFPERRKHEMAPDNAWALGTGPLPSGSDGKELQLVS